MTDKKFLIKISIVILLLLAIVFSILSILLFGINFANAEVQGDYLSYIDNFLGDRDIIQEKMINDGGDNEFLLVETSPSGYAIFAIGENDYSFIEGAKTVNSPYYEFDNENWIYLGPASYYVDKGEYYIDILSKEKVDKEQKENLEYDFLSQQRAMESIPQPYSMQDQPSFGKTYQEDEYTFIKYADFFKKSTNFPKNENNECGIISLCLLLGYLDTCMNDNFIKNKDYIAKGWHLGEQWSPAAPATAVELREHLKEKGIGVRLLLPANGFAMADMELKSTMKNYINNDSPELSAKCNHHSGSIVNTHKNPRKLINAGVPVVLVIMNYEDPTNGEMDKKGKHCVVAYGYKDDTFVTHFGWKSTSPEVYLSKYTCYAYYALEYTGEHVHSRNGYANLARTKFYCGCGEIFE